MQKSPEYKTESYSVPQAADQKDYQGVYDFSEFSVSVAAKRYIEVIPQKETKRHVPAPPEFGYVLGTVWGGKIRGKPDTKEKRHADSQHRITGKIRIDLKCIAEDSEYEP